MSIVALRQALLWCLCLNYALLIFWCATVIFRWNWLYNLCAKLFNVTRERIDTVNYAGIVFYKMAIILFNLVPFIALCIVGSGA